MSQVFILPQGFVSILHFASLSIIFLPGAHHPTAGSVNCFFFFFFSSSFVACVPSAAPLHPPTHLTHQHHDMELLYCAVMGVVVVGGAVVCVSWETEACPWPIVPDQMRSSLPPLPPSLPPSPPLQGLAHRCVCGCVCQAQTWSTRPFGCVAPCARPCWTAAAFPRHLLPSLGVVVVVVVVVALFLVKYDRLMAA